MIMMYNNVESYSNVRHLGSNPQSAATWKRAMHAFLARGCDPNAPGWQGTTAVMRTAFEKPETLLNQAARDALLERGYKLCRLDYNNASLWLAMKPEPSDPLCSDQSVTIDVSIDSWILDRKLPISNRTVRSWLEDLYPKRLWVETRTFLSMSTVEEEEAVQTLDLEVLLKGVFLRDFSHWDEIT
ncbi:hypothetical protein K402DRAFT_208034 [Aulographum hederae CBS 113979]|uniref:Uncharacterized protein n=1 Tax=Aulographum hederae CBS 113979 TaxID=1176131 RepID=A0A6G1GMX1_9PEZI|nr:hypothetical protein K402DRAFT_208034 [Aulographum hederae CBS 113979]